jgi:HK97 family phage major capsid protein
MAYNNLITRADVQALIPEDFNQQIFAAITEQSIAMRLFQREPMSREQQRLALDSAFPVAYFVNGDTGLKQTTEAGWKNKYLNAEELACIVPIPQSVFDDSGFDVWGRIRPRLVEAVGRTLDAAVFFGTNKPSTWGAAIVPAAIAAGNVVTAGGNDAAAGGLIGDISDTMATVEADGYEPTAAVASRALRAQLRQARATTGESLVDEQLPPGQTAVANVYGVPITYGLRGLWPTGTGSPEYIVGDFSEALLGVRQDITYAVFDTGVVQDGSGAIQFNLLQQDIIAMRVVARYGFEVLCTITHDQPDDAQRYPFGVLQAA